MQNNSDRIICPQITVSIITVLELILLVTFAKYITWGALVHPLISILVSIFVILGIRNKNYRYYNFAKTTSIAIGVLEAILILFAMSVLFSDAFKSQIKKQGYDYDSVRNGLTIGFTIILSFVWLESCAIIFYSRRVKYLCDNDTEKSINNTANQPLV